MFRSGPYTETSENHYCEQLISDSNHLNSSCKVHDSFGGSSQRIISTTVDEQIMETYISRTLYLCKLPYDVTENSIRELCEPFGDLKKVAVYPRKGIAFVEYFDIRKAEGARNTLKSSLVQGRVIDAQYSRGNEVRYSRDINTGTLYIKPIINDKITSDPNTDDDYKELFCTYGEVKKVSSNRKRESEKFVEFYDIRGAEASQKALNGYDFNGVILEIQFANTQSRTLNYDSRNTQSNRNGISSHLLRPNSIFKQRYRSIVGLNTRNKIVKYNTSNALRSPCIGDFSAQKNEFNDISRCILHNEINYQSFYHLNTAPSPNQKNRISNKFCESSLIPQYIYSGPTKTENIAESLKTLLSTFKHPLNENSNCIASINNT
ncbi:RNA recognition motif-containing protein [Cryptosporidium felis]|nr:RNA recognition motif-containing protein [Cryptosporidium felis]